MPEHSDEPNAPDRRASLWWIVGTVGGCVLLLGVFVWVLAGLAIDPAISAQAGHANVQALWPFWIAAGGLWLALTVLWWFCHRHPRTQSTARFVGAVGVIVLVALAARSVVLFTHQPTLSDDIYRYVFDGHNTVNGINPYLPVPATRADSINERWPGEQAVAKRVNHPDLSTIYLPTSQLVFAGATMLDQSPDESHVEARVIRGVFIGFDMATIVMLLFILYRARQSPWLATLYAWHPLSIAEIAGSGHQDPVGIALLLGSILVFTELPRRAMYWSLPLALSALVKPIAAPIALVFLKSQRPRNWLISAATALIVCVVVAGPLLLTHNAKPLSQLRATAQQFTLKWAHFGAAHEGILTAVEWITNDSNNSTDTNWTREAQGSLSRAIAASLVVTCLIAVLVLRLDVSRAALAMILAMLIFSSTVHPWYVLWALALVPVAGRGWLAIAAWILSLTVLFGYAAWGYAVDDPGSLRWAAPTWVVVSAWAGVYAALLAGGIGFTIRSLRTR